MLAVVDEHDIKVKTNASKSLSGMERLVELAECGKMMGKGIVAMG